MSTQRLVFNIDLLSARSIHYELAEAILGDGEAMDTVVIDEYDNELIEKLLTSVRESSHSLTELYMEDGDHRPPIEVLRDLFHSVRYDEIRGHVEQSLIDVLDRPDLINDDAFPMLVSCAISYVCSCIHQIYRCAQLEIGDIEHARITSIDIAENREDSHLVEIIVEDQESDEEKL